jgi:hypothetical protein
MIPFKNLQCLLLQARIAGPEFRVAMKSNMVLFCSSAAFLQLSCVPPFIKIIWIPARCQWLTPVILATQEAEIRRIVC